MPAQKTLEQLLHKAINKYDTMAVENLLQEEEIKLNLKVKGKTPLGLATERQRVDIVQLLLKANVDINQTTQCQCRQSDCPQTALSVAARVGNDQIANILLGRISGYDVQEGRYDHVVFWAARCLYNKILQVLLELGAEPNLVDNSGSSLLATVCLRGHVVNYYDRNFTGIRKSDTCRSLIEKGAGLNVFDMCDLLYLCHHGDFEVVHTLIYNGLEAVKMKEIKAICNSEMNLNTKLPEETSAQWSTFVGKYSIPRSRQYYYLTGRNLAYLISVFRGMLGCVFHDKDFRYLYNLLIEDAATWLEVLLPEDIKDQIQRIMNNVPSLRALSRNLVRRQIIQSNKYRSVVPLIKQLTCVPHSIRQQLLLTNEMERLDKIEIERLDMERLDLA